MNNKLTIFEKNGNLWTDSREVAAMIGKEHRHLLRDIYGYIESMEKSGETKNGFSSAGKLKIEPTEFFRESSYLSEQNKRLPCYDISKKGCEFVANKLTGDKGVMFTAVYVNQFNAYEEALTSGAKREKHSKLSREKRDQAMLLNAKHRMVQDYRKLYEAAGIKPEYQIMALQDYIGEDGPRLPAKALRTTKVTYDKGTIAERLGVYSTSGLAHAQAIGAVISKLDVPPEEMERVPYARNGHDGFDVQYTEDVIARVGEWLKAHRYPATLSSGSRTFRVIYNRAG